MLQADRKTILTVDDSRTMRDMLRLALSEAGHAVIQAEDGLAGTQALTETPRLDLIITDINMPRLDGYGFIDAVRHHAVHRAAPILVLSTGSDAAAKQRARQAGATGWIVKPFDPVSLLAAVAKVAP